MFIPESQSAAIFILVLMMILWGSWANLLKLAKGIRFEIFYLDFVIGALVISLVVGLTLGSIGPGQPFFESLASTDFKHILRAFLAGVLFNVANILLVAAIAFSGMAYAFITCFGMALVIDTFVAFMISHFENSLLFFLGVCLIVVALIFISLSERKIPHKLPLAKRTLTLGIMAGILIGLFYPLLARSLDLEGTKRLGPYAANFFFAIGLVICNIMINPILMRKPIFGHPITIEDYANSRWKTHLFGIGAGALWSLALSFKLIGDTPAGPMSAYICFHGATILAVLWGVLVWKEVPTGLHLFKHMGLGFACYVLGMVIIGIAKFT